MKDTALTRVHQSLGAKMVEFAGYNMPIQYSSIRAEHMRVRTTVGVFDVSHMGEFIVTGKDREAFVDRVTVNDVKQMELGQVNYSCMCLPHGGIVDDLLVYRFRDHMMLVVNAANSAKDWNWLNQNLNGDVALTDRTEEFTLLAVQGRDAAAVIQQLTATPLSEIKYYWFAEGKVCDCPAIISRTGYTGEDGFELYFDNKYAGKIWSALFETGIPYQIEPIGLGARDSLRLEMKMCLYGNDIDETTNPLEAGLGWITKLDKGEFIGRDSIYKLKSAGVSRKLIGLELEDGAFPRHGYNVTAANGDAVVGQVTSGTVSPVLDKGIAMAYLPAELSATGSEVRVDCRGRSARAKVVKTPFYKRPY